jgi:(p)ppGpp synthase/HD superfamily hydrolase
MIYTPLTKQALRLCFEAHKNQVDKSGMPYVFHPFHLAEQMDSEEAVAVALLHDVIEDTGYTLEDLAAMGFPQRVTQPLALLTHRDSVPYLEYVAEIKKDPVARAVKLADLRHNSDLSRLDTVDEKALERVAKYKEAIALLGGDKE